MRERADARLERDTAELSAWEHRELLEDLLATTAGAVGLTGDVDANPYMRAVECRRNDGRSGYAYLLPQFGAPPADDATQVLIDVKDYWQSLGYAAEHTTHAGIPAVLATSSDGSQVRVLAGPDGIGFAGETSCALTDGRPGS